MPDRAGYLQLRDISRRNFIEAHPIAAIDGLGFLESLAWFPLSGEDAWQRGHAAAMQGLAAAGFGSDRSATVDAIEKTVLAAVISALCPALSPFSGLIADVALFIVRELMSTIAGEFRKGLYGATPEAFASQMAAWSGEAATLSGATA